MSGIRRVYGTADGTDLLFSYDIETGRWEAPVPRDADGRYIVALWAEDFAGNTSYYATVLFTVDIKCMCVRVEWLDFGAQAAKTPVCGRSWMTQYDARVIRCEKCGG